MIIQPFSDIHCYDLSYMPKKTNADILICAGDFDMGIHTKKWANKVVEEHDKTMLVGLGNHDFWNTSNANMTVDEWVHYYETLNTDKLKFLQNRVEIIDDVVFIFSTLWTDFDKESNLTISTAKNISKDFSKIRVNNQGNITPYDMLNLYKEARNFIIKQLELYSNKKTVVVTHYPPTIQSNVSFDITPVSFYWCGFMEDVISIYQPNAWISGHMHNFFDKMLGDTRLILNPAGKIINGKIQMDDFVDGFTFEI